MLTFLNIYAPITIRNLTFSAQRTAMTDKAQLIVSAFSSYEKLNEETAREVIQSVNDLHTNRVLITDPSGFCLYDSLSEEQTGGVVGKLTLFPEIAEALSGSDIVYIRYEKDQFICKAAMPIVSYNRLVGAVYLVENDSDQASLITGMQRNIFWISVGLEIAIVVFSVIFAILFSRRMNKLSDSVRTMHDGDYSVRVPDSGSDELAELGSAFNDLAQRLNQSEGVRKQFVSNASHELKTPLASIKLLADSVLQNDMEQDTMREFVSDIGSEADRLTRLTAKLLELTKLDSSHAEEKQLIPVEPVAQRVLRMLVPLSRKQLVSLDLVCETDNPVLCTEDDLYQILFNLVENGIKYNHTCGEVHVLVDEWENNTRIIVEDTGSGIPDESKPHIFDRFYRVDKARSRKAGGAGLGLAIVHDMVLRNNGTVQVEDRRGGGTRFVVCFPAVRNPGEAQP